MLGRREGAGGGGGGDSACDMWHVEWAVLQKVQVAISKHKYIKYVNNMYINGDKWKWSCLCVNGVYSGQW